MNISYTTSVLLAFLEDVDYILSEGYRYSGIKRLPRPASVTNDRSDKQKRDQALHRLQRQKLIESIKNRDRILFQLTESGLIRALKAKILTQTKELPSFEACLVVFDVPNAMKPVREEVRLLLKRAGFYMVQRSVWESTRDVVNELDELIALLKAEKFILVYRVMRKRH